MNTATDEGTHVTTSADVHEPLSDAGRLLAVIAAAEELDRPLTTAELEAACYLLSETTGDLAFSYSFKFSPRPRSEQLYDQLMAIEDAGFAVRGSPLRIQPSGREWLFRPEWGAEARTAYERARTGLATLFARHADLVDLSLSPDGA
jgi:hypothetical protein